MSITPINIYTLHIRAYIFFNDILSYILARILITQVLIYSVIRRPRNTWGMLKQTMLQRTVFINKIRMLQQTRRNTIGRRSTHVPMTCRAFPLWLERQSSSLLSFIRVIYQFSLVICLFAPWTVTFFLILLCNFSHDPAKQSEKAN